MNKEEAIKKYKNLLPDDVEAIMLTRDDYDRQLGQLQFENIILKERIQKAIEYMGTHYIDLEYTKNNIGLDNVTLEIKARSLYELLDILKGGNNE